MKTGLLEPRVLKPLTVLAAASLTACVILITIRLASVVTLHRPFLANTSGLEEEAMFSLWKAQAHAPIYTDALSAPFSTSYFNWLFYGVYALWGGLWRPFWTENEAWLPTIWRVLSMVFCLGTGGVLWRLLVRVFEVRDRTTCAFLFCIAGMCVLNPLFNWMSFSVRPDTGAVFFEVTGYAIFMRAVRQPSKLVFSLAGLAALFAWEFKQSQVFFFAGGVIFLAWERRWRDLAPFACPLVVGAAATLLLSNQWYYQNTIKLHVLSSHFKALQGVAYACAAGAKAPLMPVGLATLFLMPKTWKNQPPCLRAASIMAATSISIGLVTSSKLGAADYYYLTPSLFASVLAVAALLKLPTRAGASALALVTCALICQFIVVTLVLSGRLGRVDIRKDENLAQLLKKRLSAPSGPVLITARPLNLPWIQPGRPAFVFSFLYDEYEHMYPERLIQGQGIRRLVRDGYFEKVVDADGASIDLSKELTESYTLAETGDGYRMYLPRTRQNETEAGGLNR